MGLKVSPARLRDAFLIDLEQVWINFREKYPDDTPYLFALYGVEDTPQLTPHILTEQSLTAAALRSVGRNVPADVLQESRDDLRFSIPDSPRFNDFLSGLPHVDAIFDKHAQELGEKAGYRVLAKAAMAAIKKLDERQLFGTGPAREHLLLMIVTEDCDFDWARSSVKQLNSPAAAKRFEDRTKLGPYSSADWVAISNDSRFVFSCSYRYVDRENPRRRDETINELICYRFDGLRLDRHWVFNFPSFGDSISDGAVEPNRETFVVARCRYVNGDPTTILMRFGPESNVPLDQRTYPGGVGAFAISHDGERLAVAQHNKSLMILDREFNLLRTIRPRVHTFNLHFLKCGELLHISDRRIVRLNIETGKRLEKIPLSCFRTSLGGNEKLLAVSRWFAKGIRGRERRPFGLRVLTLPDFHLYRKFFLPGRGLVLPAISPDGRFLVCQSSRIKGFRTSTVAFDLTTGDLLGELRSFPDEFAFVPNSRTVLVAGSAFGGEPVKVWQIPEAE